MRRRRQRRRGGGRRRRARGRGEDVFVTAASAVGAVASNSQCRRERVVVRARGAGQEGLNSSVGEAPLVVRGVERRRRQGRRWHR